jgi:hypothetical protein
MALPASPCRLGGTTSGANVQDEPEKLRSEPIGVTDTGIPAFTGTVDASLGLVTGSRIQGFTRGVNSLSSQLIDGVYKTVVSYTYTNNVVAGATGKAYAGGLMAARSNRTE